MENRDWTAELRSRVFRHLTRTQITDLHQSSDVLERIMADIEVFGVLKAREGYRVGYAYREDRDWRDGRATFRTPDAALVDYAHESYPLPHAYPASVA